MIWNVPGLKGGRRSKALTQGIDYLPTLIELTGGKALPELPGRTIFTSASYGELSRDLVEKNKMSQEDPEAPLHTLAEENSSDSTNRYSMVRTHEWKFPLSESRPPELYRMNEGWIERENVAEKAEHATVRRGMEQKLRAFWRW